jgi:hypothetical protein
LAAPWLEVATRLDDVDLLPSASRILLPLVLHTAQGL